MSLTRTGFFRHGLLLLLSLLGLTAARFHSYLLFHSFAELFSVVVACGIFVVAWNSRHFAGNGFLQFVGGAYLFVALLDTLHALAFNGMGVFEPVGHPTNLATELWIAARALQSVALLVAAFFVRKPVKLPVVLVGGSVVTTALLLAIFSGYFPDCFDANGLTQFKKFSEYAICLLLALAAIALYRHRYQFDAQVRLLIIASITFTILSELSFVYYADPYGALNLLGHYFKVVAFYFLYKAIVETSLVRPYELLFRDLSASEEALRESEQRYRCLVELSPRAVVVTNNDRFVYANPAAAALFGAASADTLRGLSLSERIRPEDRPRFARSQLATHGGLSADALVELRVRRLDGAEVSVESLAGEITYENRPAILFIFGDITERKHTEEVLRQAKAQAEAASRAKDEFLAALSHELRTPLTPVLAATSAMGSDPSLSPELRDDLAMIRRNVELQARLIDDLLDLTRIARGKISLTCTRVDAHQTLHDAIAICRPDLEQKGQRLELHLQADHHHLHADAARLQQIFWNLLKNAVKFTPPGGRITVRTSNPQGPSKLQLDVCDTGVGIEPDVLPNIFGAFEQGGSGVTRQFGGLGLGLAISKTMVELHGGTIAASSPGRDRGATFTIVLPTATAPLAHEHHPSSDVPARAPGRRLSILLVEDHPDTAYLLARLLERLDHDVHAVHTVRSALQAAQSSRFDLLISDLGLPDGSGLELMRQIREMCNLPGICLSGFGMDRDLLASREAGFDHHLIKPVDFGKLRQAIAQVSARL